VYLKSLTLRGFKSFASSTTLRFEPGITCVVGPNGSGKSNVVDALAWVMGEQGAKSLRGGKMEDVIFAGTASRPPLGRAEVVLTIDNSDGALPIDYTEVTISRLMFRSGQSEYSINGDSCRLLDVQELLSDSGMGREMHVIVGQGQLDTVLQAGPEGRRALIEEAAGVLKHRKRKEKALRKLDAMQANLTRLQDLTAELRRQLKPLGRQAEIARKAAAIQADLRDARLRLLADDLVTLRTTLEREQADEASVRERRAAVEAELTAAQDRESELDAAAQAAAPRLARVQETWYALSALRERLRGVAELAAERHRHATEEAGAEHQRRGRDPEDMEREATEIREQEGELRELLEREGEALTLAVHERAAAESALKDEERRLAAARAAEADRREGLAELRGRVEALRSRLAAHEEEIGRLTEALAAAERRADEARGEHAAQERRSGADVDPELAADHERAQAVLEGAKGRIKQAKAAVEAPRRELRAAGAGVAEARTAHQEAERDVAALRARIEALELGVGRAADGGERLLAAGRPGVLGTVAGMITVAPGAEVAIAAALGTAAEAVAVASLEDAEDALFLLRDEDAGRAGLVIGGAARSADEFAAENASEDARDSAGGNAGAGEAPAGRWALDLVTADEPLRAALGHLLAGVVVVNDLAAARSLVARRPRLRAVTREGDLLGAHWAHGGGEAGGQSLLEMRAAIDDAVDALAAARDREVATCEGLETALAAEREAQAALDAAQSAVADAQAGAGQAQSDLDRLAARLREADATAAQHAKRLATLAAAARAAQEEAERLDKALHTAGQARERDLAGLAELEQRLAAEEAEPDPAAGLPAERADELREELAERCQQARTAEMEARLSVRTAEERVAAIAGRADSLERSAARERDERARAAARRERLARAATVAAAVASGAQTTLRRLEISLAAAVAGREAAEREQAAREEQLKGTRARVRELAVELEKLVSVVHGSEVARAEQRLRLEQLEEKALEDYGMEIDALVAEYGPDQAVPAGYDDNAGGRGGRGTAGARHGADSAGADDPGVAEDPLPMPYDRAATEKRARRAERQLQQLGKVNPLALEEFAALEERHAFLTSQLEDLKKTRRDLLTVIKEVDGRVEQVFAAAFEDTEREFEQIFARLFPGGNGRLVLTEPEDMLTTGVEVEARPPGKKVKRLSLLSGGERSLVAIALLLAIFRARPSPFYVLDEVEAALDDTNLQRLLGTFEELRESSQLIIITHQKRTMECADALYGASMRGDGVTQVVSQRLREHEPA
jgi:chromosome segregation protein